MNCFEPPTARFLAVLQFVNQRQKMKKFITIILGTIIITPTYATTMCTTNDTVAIVLDPSEPIKGNTGDTVTGTWSAWSSYGTIHGISTCINKAENGRGIATDHLTDTNNNEEKLVTGNEQYGKNCWCRIIHPALSLWFFHRTMSSSGECSNSLCAKECLSANWYDVKARSTAFKSFSKN